MRAIRSESKTPHDYNFYFAALLFQRNDEKRDRAQWMLKYHAHHKFNGEKLFKEQRKAKKSSCFIQLNLIKSCGVLYSMVIVYRFLLSFILNLVQSFPMTESPNYINLIDTSNASPITSQLVNWTIFDNKLQILKKEEINSFSLKHTHKDTVTRIVTGQVIELKWTEGISYWK